MNTETVYLKITHPKKLQNKNNKMKQFVNDAVYIPKQNELKRNERLSK